jgi:hypothetical protein
MSRRMLGVAAAAAAWALMLGGSASAAGWQVAPSANPNPYENFLLGVARVPGTGHLWAAGYTLDQVGPDHSLIEHSSGGAFTVSPIPHAGRFEQLSGVSAASATAAWAVGGSFGQSSLPLVFAWNGTGWRRTPVPLPPAAAGGSLISVRAFSATDVTAVGTWFSSTAAGGPLIEHWDGHTWSASIAPDPAGCQATFTSVAAVPGSAGRFAAGFCINADGTATRAVIERLTGAGWSIVPAHAPAGSALQSITPVSGTEIWAVGSQTTMSGAERTLAERWNGSAWSVVPTPNPTGNDRLESVVRVPGTGTLWAVGAGSNTQGSVAIAERWTGTAWQSVPPAQPSAEVELDGVAATPAGVWAVGDLFPDAPGSGPVARTLAEHTPG